MKSPAKKTGQEGTEGSMLQGLFISIYSSQLKNEILGA
jgi:hypothetical protein